MLSCIVKPTWIILSDRQGMEKTIMLKKWLLPPFQRETETYREVTFLNLNQIFNIIFSDYQCSFKNLFFKLLVTPFPRTVSMQFIVLRSSIWSYVFICFYMLNLFKILIIYPIYMNSAVTYPEIWTNVTVKHPDYPSDKIKIFDKRCFRLKSCEINWSFWSLLKSVSQN